MGLNAQRLFWGSADQDDYLSALTLSPERKAILREARDECRAAIRGGLNNWSAVIQRSELFDRALHSVEVKATLQPKFRMQGSFAYHTLNEPAQTPPQEVDLDDGVFVPVSFLKDSSGPHPVLASRGYFLAVERLLAPICKKNDWTLVTDKPSCVRVIIAKDAHIDLALYAIPDEEFQKLTESVLAKANNAMDSRSLAESVELYDSIYEALRDDQIMLAHRDEGWRASDPRKLEDWFKDALRSHGEQFRRVCRYLKGWRDHNWQSCRLSSIAIMSCTVTVYDEAPCPIANNRDDKALLQVAERLADLLGGRIVNPVVQGQYLDEGWTLEERNDFITKAKSLRQQLRTALNGTDRTSESLESIKAAFGPRIPNDHNLIRQDTEGSIPSGSFVSAIAPAGAYVFPDAMAAPKKPRGFA